MLGNVIIGLGILMILYGAYKGLSANNIFMKNPSRDSKDRFKIDP
jgi:hypothetical protein